MLKLSVARGVMKDERCAQRTYLRVCGSYTRKPSKLRSCNDAKGKAILRRVDARDVSVGAPVRALTIGFSGLDSTHCCCHLALKVGCCRDREHGSS